MFQNHSRLNVVIKCFSKDFLHLYLLKQSSLSGDYRAKPRKKNWDQRTTRLIWCHCKWILLYKFSPWASLWSNWRTLIQSASWRHRVLKKCIKMVQKKMKRMEWMIVKILIVLNSSEKKIRKGKKKIVHKTLLWKNTYM